MGYRGPPPVKKGMSGCLLAFLIAGGLFLLVAVGGGIWAYMQFSEFIGATKDMAKLMIEAQNAPGAAEIRKLGCNQAIVLDMAKLSEVAQRFEDEIARREGRSAKKLDLGEEATYFVQCQAGFTDKISCQAVADAFVGAVEPSGKFVVQVADAGGNQQQCNEAFDAKGRSLGKTDAPDLPDTSKY
jgi:hypothetical protein